MKDTVLFPVRQALARGVKTLGSVQADPAAFHLPARTAPAGVFLPENARMPYRWVYPCDAFGNVLDAPLVLSAVVDGSFLLLHFTGSFYDALTVHICRLLPPPIHDCGCLALNRMMALSRKPGCGCPDDPAARRLLWQLVCLSEHPRQLPEVERAATAYLTHLLPRDRQRLAMESGAFADAAARILYQFRKDASHAD